MPEYDIKIYTEDLTGDILDSLMEEIKRIDQFQYMIPERKISLFREYFRGLKDGLGIASKGVLNQERMKDPIIRMIDEDIIGGLISGRLNERGAWEILLKDIAGL